MLVEEDVEAAAAVAVDGRPVSTERSGFLASEGADIPWASADFPEVFVDLPEVSWLLRAPDPCHGDVTALTLAQLPAGVLASAGGDNVGNVTRFRLGLDRSGSSQDTSEPSATTCHDSISILLLKPHRQFRGRLDS